MTTFMIAVVEMMVGAAVGFLHRSPHLRNGLVRPAFALHVMAGGHVPTESGGLPTESGARKGSLHKDCIRTRGGLLARTGRAIGLEWQEGSLPSNHVLFFFFRNSERRTMQAVQRHTAAQSAQQGRGRSATSADPY